MAKVNVEAIRTDLEKYGITQAQVEAACGKSRSWLGNILAEGEAPEENLRLIEKALFKAPGAYELKNTETPTTSCADDNLTAAIELLAKQQAEILQTIKVMRAWQEEMLSEIKAWRKGTEEQAGAVVGKLGEVSTQIMKCRSAMERSAEK